MKVLYVAFDPLVPDVLSVFLKSYGIEVVLVRNVRQAKEEIDRSNTFSAVCSDAMLHGETGIDFYRWLRDEKKSDLPFIFITALNITSEIGKKIRNDRNCLYFQKPVDIDEVVVAIREVAIND